jgi:hypothetical protein
MPPFSRDILEAALFGLEARREKIARQIADLNEFMGSRRSVLHEGVLDPGALLGKENAS